MKRSLLPFVALALGACHFEPPPPAVPGPTTAHPAIEGLSAASQGAVRTLAQRDERARVVAIRVVFKSGSADDPRGKEGLTQLAATMMAEGGTKKLAPAELSRALYPTAAHVGVNVDRDETTFETEVAADGLETVHEIFRDVLIAPRLDEEGFTRLKARQTSELTDDLRSSNDEELGKEVLATVLYENHPYGHPTQGTERGLASITRDDVLAHAKSVFCKDRVLVGVAGAFPVGFERKLAAELAALPACSGERAALPAVPPRKGLQIVLVDKPTAESTAISMGYATDLGRASDDFAAAYFATAWIGLHRQSAGLLYQRLREARGFNYGDYAYPEHFDQDGWSRFPRPNVVRRQQDMSIWLRPVKPANAPFALRGALHYWRQLIDKGIDDAEIARFRTFLTRYIGLEQQTETRRLGYAMDDAAWDLAQLHVDRLVAGFAALDAAKLKAVIGKRFNGSDMAIAIVTNDAAGLKKTLVSGKPTPPVYDAPKPKDVLDEDKLIEKLSLGLEEKDVRIVPIAEVFR